jgi:mutator protein MutT
MKQYVSVRAIIKQKGKTLLLRRAEGRASIVGLYELPGGKIKFGEQPEDALARIFMQDIGAEVQTEQLFDVLTYVDHDSPDIQYVFILYLVSLRANSLQLGSKYDKFAWKKSSEIQQREVTESTEMILGLVHGSPSLESVGITTSVKDTTHLIVYSDGGSRGNPGPSAAAYVIFNTSDEVIDQGSQYLGLTTNNQAEYHGVRLGLEKARLLGARTVDFRSDSMLVVNQMNGIYAIKNRELWPIYERIQELQQLFEKVTFTHVKREFNGLADGLVNKSLNYHASNGV